MTQAEAQFAAGQTAREVFGFGPFGRNTRERLIDEAMDLFYTHGIHAVGLDQILGRVGVTKTTFYNHFESKDELAVAAINLRDQRELEALHEAVVARAGDDPHASMLAVFEAVDEWFTGRDYNGCIFINACAEFPSRHDPVHIAARAHWDTAKSVLREWAAAAGARDPDALAAELALLLQGAFTQRLVEGADDAAKIARRAAERAMAAQI